MTREIIERTMTKEIIDKIEALKDDLEALLEKVRAEEKEQAFERNIKKIRDNIGKDIEDIEEREYRQRVAEEMIRLEKKVEQLKCFLERVDKGEVREELIDTREIDLLKVQLLYMEAYLNVLKDRCRLWELG